MTRILMRMMENDYSQLPVVDEQGNLAGIICRYIPALFESATTPSSGVRH